MAIGDVTWFEETWKNLHDGDLDLSADVIKLALITTTPVASATLPAWTGGTTNYSGDEVTPGGNYAANGATCANAVITEVGGAVTFDTDDPLQWDKDVGNPTDALFGILYDSSITPELALAFVDLGGVFNMVNGDLDVNAPASGWWSES